MDFNNKCDSAYKRIKASGKWQILTFDQLSENSFHFYVIVDEDIQRI